MRTGHGHEPDEGRSIAVGRGDDSATRRPREGSALTRAGWLFVVGLATAIWSASGYVGAFTRAANVIYETPEGRPFWKLRPLQLLITLVMIVLLALVLLALIFTGPVVTAVAGPKPAPRGAAKELQLPPRDEPQPRRTV